MRLVTYRHNSKITTGAVVGDRVIDLPWLCAAPPDMAALLGTPGVLEAARLALHSLPRIEPEVFPPLKDVTLLPPVTRPGKIIGVAMNYPAPGQDRRSACPPFPVLFERNAGSLIGTGEAIRLPRSAREVVIECELALVVGHGGKRIPESRALATLAGYTIANDVTARDLERRSSQWTSGKLADAFLPLGPVLMTADELHDPGMLRIQAWINGQAVQDGSTAEMYYTPAELVVYISSLITLQPGDLILTGSPKSLRNLPAREVFLQPGDRVKMEIEGLGILENLVEED